MKTLEFGLKSTKMSVKILNKQGISSKHNKNNREHVIEIKSNQKIGKSKAKSANKN